VIFAHTAYKFCRRNLELHFQNLIKTFLAPTLWDETSLLRIQT